MSLKKTALWLSLLALIVKFSGFLRESIIANQFGANYETDGYVLAFSFITLALAMISGGFNNVFLPLYVKNRQENPEQTERNANAIMNWTVLLFLGISIVGWLLAPYFVPLIYGKMSPETAPIAISITQFFFLFISVIALNGILDSYLQGQRIFVPSQVSKLSATLMGAVFALLFSDQWGINSLAYGFIFGTILGVLIQLFFLRKKGWRWSPALKVEEEYKRTFLVLLIPSLLNSVVGQINMFVNKSFAVGTIKGAATYINNATLITSIPHTIYGTTIAVIIFTLLAEQIDNKKKFQDTFFMGMQVSLLTLAPIAAGFFLVGQEVIAFVFQRGKFTADDTYNTYLALIYYLPTIVTQGLQYIVSKSMYARGKTSIIFRISVTTIALNALLNWLLVDRFGYPGLALTGSFVSIYYLVVSTIFVYKDFDKKEATRLFGLIGRVAVVTAFMVLPLYLLKTWTPISHLYSLWQLMIIVPLGVVFYTAGLFFFYKQGFNQVLHLLKRKAHAK
ncbi:murein biosynthesis integral membrane protein MurJ [Pseudobacillus badius]|uniref:murein biosynthesis integral membrane protein MurJ n=1 Tax=Bacillus badius TaxID=1455 RepID=UPI0007B09FF1|nr:lipid II flippase MurJ [Bacillus badius]KZN99971.1 murein biosynthesis protein MurJ [Bacillus badius]OCS86136.1 murein biosynthesis protein MurJ [Bacillus badius]OVE52403.1 murein biosynthesis protein MurJ [Bacillus badius]TDW04139.1 putative peptidoglycan lipid II flippase [Bacillus badius]UAT30517.1 polysaccharide biosynthesis C-terminal domain-containing protein [Bacillus badius]